MILVVDHHLKKNAMRKKEKDEGKLLVVPKLTSKGNRGEEGCLPFDLNSDPYVCTQSDQISTAHGNVKAQMVACGKEVVY